MGGIGTQEGEALNEDHRGTLSPQEMGERFDLLAAESGFDHYFVKPAGLEKLSELFQTIQPVPDAP